MGIAAGKGHAEVCRTLVTRKAQLDAQCKLQCTPVYIASQNGKNDVVKLLLEKKGSIDTPRKGGFTPLFIASQNGHADTVKLLLESGTKVDREACTTIAKEKGHDDVLAVLTSAK